MPRGRPKSNTGENIMTESLTQVKFPYHTMVVTYAKMGKADNVTTFSQEYIDNKLKQYKDLGYRVHTAAPLRDIGDGITIMYFLELIDE